MPHAAAAQLVRGAVVRATRGPDGTTIRFLITGCGAALLFFVLSFSAIRAGLSPFAGTLSAYAVCFVTAYLTQRAWTFGSAHRHRDALPRYLVAQLACGLLSACLARLLGRIGLAPLPMAALVTVASSSASYALSRFWVFAAQTAGPSYAGEDEATSEPAGQGQNGCL